LAYLKAELEAKERVIYENEHFVVLVPFWATWPFETMILPKLDLRDLRGLTPALIADLAAALSKLTKAYDAVFKVSFPYSAGFHQAPCDGIVHPEWTLHMHFYPPLLRSATVKKFQVGYELLAEAQRDMTPEQSAEILRNLVC
jgi:UDPglucose--hexose-1-phosphate uridylyltransferase